MSYKATINYTITDVRTNATETGSCSIHDRNRDVAVAAAMARVFNFYVRDNKVLSGFIVEVEEA